MSLMKQNASAVLNAMDEARVSTVIQFVESGELKQSPNVSKYDTIAWYCNKLNVQNLEYWMDDWFSLSKTM